MERTCKKILISIFFVGLTLMFLSPTVYALRFVKQKAPSFSQSDIRGKHQSLRRYQGKQLVLYFWATWCPACRRDVPNLKKVFEEYQPKGVEIVTVSLDVELERLEEFVEEEKIAYPVLFDGKGWQNEIANKYKIRSTPSYVLIDPDSMIQGIGSWSRELEEDLRAMIDS